MIKIDNKYKIGQTVYFIDKDDQCKSFVIKEISVVITASRTNIIYYNGKDFLGKFESELFGSLREVREHVFNQVLDVQ